MGARTVHHSAWVLPLILLVPISVRSDSALRIRPYRVLVVVEQWDDPASVLVDFEKDEFQPVVALLKAWSVPFDIFRLDQQHLDASYLLDRSGAPRYGAVLWLADCPSYAGQNLASLEQSVHAGTSLFFTVVTVIQFFVVLFVYPETKRVSLEEMQPVLNWSSAESHARAPGRAKHLPKAGELSASRRKSRLTPAAPLRDSNLAQCQLAMASSVAACSFQWATA